MIQFFDYPTDRPIGIVNRTGINSCSVFEFPISGNNLIWCGNWCMRFMEPKIQKERSLGMPMIIQPINSFIGHQLTGVSFQWSDSLSVSNKIIRILMTGRCIIPCGKPVIKTMMTGGGLRPVLCRQTQMPFSNVGSGIPSIL